MHLFALASKDMHIRMTQHANTDPKSVMAATMRRTPRVGSNGGTAAGLVGSYDQVAERIVAFNRAGIETFMLQYQPFEAEMRTVRRRSDAPCQCLDRGGATGRTVTSQTV